jgi:hypothetical protein
MITASEAFSLVEASNSTIDKMLKILDPKIRAAAEKGQRQLPVFEEGWWDSVPSMSNIKPSPKQDRLIAALANHGFSARLENHGGVYIPKGLADDDGNGPEYVNACIVIRW